MCFSEGLKGLSGSGVVGSPHHGGVMFLDVNVLHV